MRTSEEGKRLEVPVGQHWGWGLTGMTQQHSNAKFECLSWKTSVEQPECELQKHTMLGNTLLLHTVN